MSEEWVHISCHTVLEAVHRAIETTFNYNISVGGDFGQDEGRGECGMGNDDWAVVVWPNGTAILSVRKFDNERYLNS
jgi:hypothetical protein